MNKDWKLWRAAQKVWLQRRETWGQWIDANEQRIYAPEAERLHDRYQYAFSLYVVGCRQIEAQYAAALGIKPHEPSGEYFLSNGQKIELGNFIEALRVAPPSESLRMNLWDKAPRLRQFHLQK